VPRDTRTGNVLESMIVPALRGGGYQWQLQVTVGTRPGGGRHVVDFVVEVEGGTACLVSVKWQQTSGTAEQKVPFEAICLAEAMRSAPDRYVRAYLVLGGDGWTLRTYYTEGGLDDHLKHCDSVKIVKLERFVALANQRRL